MSKAPILCGTHCTNVQFLRIFVHIPSKKICIFLSFYSTEKLFFQIKSSEKNFYVFPLFFRLYFYDILAAKDAYTEKIFFL